MSNSFRDRMKQKNASVIEQSKANVEEIVKARETDAPVIEQESAPVKNSSVVAKPTDETVKPDKTESKRSETTKAKSEDKKPAETKPETVVKPVEIRKPVINKDKFSGKGDKRVLNKCVSLTKENFKTLRVEASRNDLNISEYVSLLLERAAALYDGMSANEKDEYMDQLFDFCEKRYTIKDRRITFILSDVAHDYSEEIVTRSGITFTTFINYILDQTA